jgi:hypothetical protein
LHLLSELKTRLQVAGQRYDRLADSRLIDQGERFDWRSYLTPTEGTGGFQGIKRFYDPACHNDATNTVHTGGGHPSSITIPVGTGGSPSAIWRIVRRRILPERVLGSPVALTCSGTFHQWFKTGALTMRTLPMI